MILQNIGCLWVHLYHIGGCLWVMQGLMSIIIIKVSCNAYNDMEYVLKGCTVYTMTVMRDSKDSHQWYLTKFRTLFRPKTPNLNIMTKSTFDL